MTGQIRSSVDASRNPLDDLLDDLAARIQAGESVDIEAFARENPEHASELRRLLPAMQILAGLPRSGEPGTSVIGGSPESLGELGDFRLIREVGRGGMGVVYEAEQISLRRRVALKVLPWAAAMDPKQLQRFKNEALAAASLKHDHIVSVFAVGCERGVHYYAMEFVDGHTLADVITARQAAPASPDRQQPANQTCAFDPAIDAPVSPGRDTVVVVAASTQKTARRNREFYRSTASLIADAADALEHAHSLGIVHRDIKPGNLLVDAAGKIYVSDFGLARFGPDAGLTMSGDLLGTLRYMAPEQALARHGLADHRVDVYGLGCTLYELLTGKPAVGGADKAEILKHIAFEEPIVPRKLDKAIPAELETIALKCLAKNPNERYATAGDLAADLRRFVGDQPIQAKPLGLATRAAKWIRRHRYLMWTGAAMICIAALASSIAAYAIWQKSIEVGRAYDAEVRERKRAEANLRTAKAAVDRMLINFGNQSLKQIPAVEMVRQRILQDGLALYQELLKEQGDDSQARNGTAFAFDCIGRIEDQLGRYPEAIAAYREGIRLRKDLAAEEPEEPEHLYGLMGCLCNLGNALSQKGDCKEAETVYSQAIDVGEKLVAQFPANARYQDFLVNTYHGRSVNENMMGGFEKAACYQHRAVDLVENLTKQFPNEASRRISLASNQSELAAALKQLGNVVEAEPIYRKAMRTQESLLSAYPDDPDLRRGLAVTCDNLGSLLRESGRLKECDTLYDTARRHLERLSRDFPNILEYRQKLVQTYGERGETLLQMGRRPEAETMFRLALQIGDKLVEERPGDPDCLFRLAAIQADWAGMLAEDPRHLPDALKWYDRARQAVEKLAADYSNRPVHRRQLAQICAEQGAALQRLDRLAETEAMFQRALSLANQLVQQFPQNADYRELMAHCAADLAWLRANCTDPAIRSVPEAVKLASRAVANAPDDSYTHDVLGFAHFRAGNWQGAVEEIEKSIKLSKGEETAADSLVLAIANWKLGKAEPAQKAYARALTTLRKDKDPDEEVIRLRGEAEKMLGISAPASIPPEAKPGKEP